MYAYIIQLGFMSHISDSNLMSQSQDCSMYGDLSRLIGLMHEFSLLALSHCVECRLALGLAHA